MYYVRILAMVVLIIIKISMNDYHDGSLLQHNDKMLTLRMSLRRLKMEWKVILILNLIHCINQTDDILLYLLPYILKGFMYIMILRDGKIMETY